ncbi:hypothetical protein [Halobacillus aidingensis]|uniref:hypothetical protein n=1 Tax=Halobacillus aidingensis TaxID=240303 RepID=UPI000B7F4541|nr:hypothetical protein [Halobacillus aidingensis]
MKKIWTGILLIGIVTAGFLVSLSVFENEENQVSKNPQSEVTGEDSEEVAEIISYIKDGFSNHDKIKNVYFDKDQKAISIESTLTKDDLQEGLRFEKELVKQLQLYNQSGDRISYLVVINFSDGTAFSSSAFMN